MSTKGYSGTIDRRRFLTFGGLAIGAGAAGAVLSNGIPAKAATVAEDRPKSAGYRETDHVRRFYDLAKF